ncbi:SusC/RagA family TonB-linked outer membrane protein [Capnocytophaga cynodegmi]|uniref:SusC/RagA family TonB-linked outer membrane protein n=1 Tax=Capnocytophaga cynodegmi TaxID=28189 RepID=UPI001BB401CC|nr:TonB-dependent receptor [Capnocytophaga cynodegmi]
MKEKLLKKILIFSLSFFFGELMAQEIEVSGTVTSSSDGMPLIGVSVVVKGTTRGVATDFDGNFTIQAKDGETLQFTSIGFKTLERKVTGSVMNVALEEEASQLDEVVVTGYGTQSRNTLATSVSKLDTKTLESAPRANVATALQGSVAGLRVTPATGKPGATPDIQLRGGTDFNGSGSPLILVDGVPSSFYALNSDDIESIEVLKDAASTAIYGARAANGVVLVTTKKGKLGRSNITFRTKYTLNKRRKLPEYLNARDYIYWNRKAIQNVQSYGVTNFNPFLTGAHSMGIGNNTTSSTYTTMELTPANAYLLNYPEWQQMQDPIDPNRTLIFQDNNMSELIFQYSDAKDYSISFDGGNERGSYYLGLGYLDDTGLVLGSNFKRYSGTLNASYKLTDKFKISSNVIYAQTNRRGSFREALNSYDNEDDYFIFQRFAGQAPTSRIYNTNVDGSSSSEYNPGTNSGFGNPLYYQDKFLRDDLEQRISASVQFDLELAKNLNLMARGSHFAAHNNVETFRKAYINSGALVTNRLAKTNYDRTIRNQGTVTLNYKDKFAEKHNINMLFGGEFFKEMTFNSNATTENSPTDLIRTLNVGAASSGIPSSYRKDYTIISGFGQLNYDYDNRYLVGLTFRYDGTSKLRDNKYGFFPGASIGWNVHNESFFADSKVSQVVSRLKPRISYGVNGNIDALTLTIDNKKTYYWLLGQYGVQDPYNGRKGYVNTSIPVYYLKWERATTLNFGLDLGLFNNRVNLLADYFIRDVYDKLADQRIPISTGFSSVKINSGTLRNQGIELEANVRIIDTENMKWNFGANFTRIRNYVRELPYNGNDNNRIGGEEVFDPATGKTIFIGGRQEGQRVGDDLVIGYLDEGVYQTQEQLDQHKGRKVQFHAGTIPAAQRGTPILGDTRWKDINGDNIIDSKDRVVLGRTTPSYMGGFSTDFSYKNFSIYVKTDYAVGHLVHNAVRSRGISQAQGNQNWTSEIKDTWTPENPTATIPRFDFTDPRGNHKAVGGQATSSSRYWEKGDYLAIREVTLGYNLSGNAIGNYFKDVRFFLTGANLAYFTKYTGYLPEKGGWDSGRFPLARTFTFGVNATF